MLDFSVIIVNYNSEHLLRDCLFSLQGKIINRSYEAVIVNNDSKKLKEIRLPNVPVRIIDNDSNDGFAKACNIGAQAAKGKVLFFLNPDTRIISSDIDNLFTALNETGVGIVAPKLVLPDNTVQPWSAGVSINIWTLIKNNLGLTDNKVSLDNEKASRVDWVSGAAFVITKKLFDLHGGFDEKFFMYFEDIDLCLRIRKSGHQILRLPSVSVLHLGGQSYDGLSQQKKHYYQSQDYYFKKHFGILASAVVKVFRSLAAIFQKLMITK